MWDFGLSEGALSTTFLLGSVAAISYFVLIRPQQKQRKQHEDLIGSLKKGDEIILSCGIAGRVHAVDDRFVNLEIGDRARMKVVREAVHARMDPQQPPTPKPGEAKAGAETTTKRVGKAK
ncbi:MAG: preprotein translocase subunit YajC [Myxococcota bacterium]